MENPGIFKQLYQIMVKIRRFEEKLVELYPGQDMKTPIHLCIGQEAIAAGVCINLLKEDYVFSTHRGHGHYIAKGGNLGELFAELYGKKTGCARGKGGSMHLVAPEVGILGNSAIVGGNIPISCGAALSSVIRGSGQIAVSFFGDGGVDTGAFHESLNFASLKKLPVVFVCENNFYATNSYILARQPLDNIYKRAEGYGMPGVRVDGNDVLDVFNVAKKAIDRARKGAGPTLIEARTYRWKQHVGSNTDFEKGCRPKEELDKWMKKCPVKRYEKILLKEKILSKQAINKIIQEIDREIEEAFLFAKESPFPAKSELCKDVD